MIDDVNELTVKGAEVCVLCGAPWIPAVKNRCECGGFCTWGRAKGAEPTSWIKTERGYHPRMPGEQKPDEDTNTLKQ